MYQEPFESWEIAMIAASVLLAVFAIVRFLNAIHGFQLVYYGCRNMIMGASLCPLIVMSYWFRLGRLVVVNTLKWFIPKVVQCMIMSTLAAFIVLPSFFGMVASFVLCLPALSLVLLTSLQVGKTTEVPMETDTVVPEARSRASRIKRWLVKRIQKTCNRRVSAKHEGKRGSRFAVGHKLRKIGSKMKSIFFRRHTPAITVADAAEELSKPSTLWSALQTLFLASFFVCSGPLVALLVVTGIMVGIFVQIAYLLLLSIAKGLVFVGQESGVPMEPELALAQFVEKYIEFVRQYGYFWATVFDVFMSVFGDIGGLLQTVQADWTRLSGERKAILASRSSDGSFGTMASSCIHALIAIPCRFIVDPVSNAYHAFIDQMVAFSNCITAIEEGVQEWVLDIVINGCDKSVSWCGGVVGVLQHTLQSTADSLVECLVTILDFVSAVSQLLHFACTAFAHLYLRIVAGVKYCSTYMLTIVGDMWRMIKYWAAFIFVAVGSFLGWALEKFVDACDVSLLWYSGIVGRFSLTGQSITDTLMHTLVTLLVFAFTLSDLVCGGCTAVHTWLLVFHVHAQEWTTAFVARCVTTVTLACLSPFVWVHDGVNFVCAPIRRCWTGPATQQHAGEEDRPSKESAPRFSREDIEYNNFLFTSALRFRSESQGVRLDFDPSRRLSLSGGDPAFGKSITKETVEDIKAFTEVLKVMSDEDIAAHQAFLDSALSSPSPALARQVVKVPAQEPVHRFSRPLNSVIPYFSTFANGALSFIQSLPNGLFEMLINVLFVYLLGAVGLIGYTILSMDRVQLLHGVVGGTYVAVMCMASIEGCTGSFWYVCAHAIPVIIVRSLYIRFVLSWLAAIPTITHSFLEGTRPFIECIEEEYKRWRDGVFIPYSCTDKHVTYVNAKYGSYFTQSIQNAAVVAKYLKRQEEERKRADRFSCRNIRKIFFRFLSTDLLDKACFFFIILLCFVCEHQQRSRMITVMACLHSLLRLSEGLVGTVIFHFVERHHIKAMANLLNNQAVAA